MKFSERGSLGRNFDPALGDGNEICPSECADGMGPFWGLQLRRRRWPGRVVEASANHVPSWAGLRCQMGKGQ